MQLVSSEKPKPIPIGPYVRGEIIDYLGRPSTKHRRYQLSLRRWYVVQCEPQQVRKVEDLIGEAQFGTYLPLVPRKVRIVRERYRMAMKPMLAGYLFAGFDATNEPWQSIMDMRGVLRVFMYDSRPVPMGEFEMQCVREAEERECAGGARKIALLGIKPKDFVQVTDGPFASFFGFVVEVDQKAGRAKVEVDIFGRKVPVELDGRQLEVVLDSPKGLTPYSRPQYARPRSPR